MTLYEKIIKLCSERGIKKTELERACGLSQNSINKWSTQSPSADKVLRIAEYFGVSVDYLLGHNADNNAKQTISQSIGDNSPNNIQFVGSKNSITPNSRIENIILQEILKLTDEEKQRLLSRINSKNLKNNNFANGGLTVVEGFNKGILYNFEVNKECPLCGSAIIPNLITSIEVDFNGYKAQDKRQRIAIFSCPACSKIFSVLYENPVINDKDTIPQTTVVSYKSQKQLLSCDCVYTPFLPSIKKIPNEFTIKNNPEAFSKFRIAYNDLQLLKAYNINNLIGMAVRRCIDYLVHDYIAYKKEEEVCLSQLKKYKTYDKIPLGELISCFVRDDDIIDLAKRINWLANDFTHYFNNHPEYNEDDVNSLFEWLVIDIRALIAKNEAKKINKKY